MANRDIIVIGASAGGVEAVSQLVAELPADLPAAVFVTLHFPRNSTSMLPRILTRAGPLEAVHPTDQEPIRAGRIYVAPPDYHLIVGRGHVHLVRGPTENGNRPAVDPMFRSAAVAFGPRVIGVVLSGNLDDGTAGLYSIRRRGGLGLAQDPEEAHFPSMPVSARRHGVVDEVLPVRELASRLDALARERIIIRPEDTVDDHAARETDFARFDLGAISDESGHPGEPSPYSCPDCGGVLWAIADDDLPRYRCRVGHAWTQDALLMQQAETLDVALWTALRALEENA
ncbi:MAG TPA: chemotaxis protein CheB, partial [Gemmatimonadaceae bacterium]|nr:chemotaxis protein CheB [Gemmatimonadaceae bacterium]